MWKKFAQANNWRCTDGGGDLPPSLHFGANYTFTPSIEMDMGNGLVCQLFGCSWDEEYSRGALGRIDRALGGHRTLTSHYYTVASVRLQQDLPHIMLRNKTSKVKDRTEMTNATDLQLEGDFNKYFKLQIEKGQQVDALQVLTPDVMQTLLTYSSREDIELSGKLLSFIIGGDKRDAADVQALIRSVFALTTQIMENLRLAGSLPPPQNITAKS
ncbi:MAG TPA: hypothetical protein VHA37_08355 [Candidatus Saccharimonadales bacterium]|nr:hypothetical protein [Candidatus Saccharimonadales bacterium]